MKIVGLIVVAREPQRTRNLFGPLSEIAGHSLLVLERNEEGDCLCLFNGAAGTNLVDVAACDVRYFVATGARPVSHFGERCASG